MTLGSATSSQILTRLERLYGAQAAACAEKIEALVAKYAPQISPRDGGWDERDSVLITYGDQVSATGESTLTTLRRFLVENDLNEAIRAVHLLPFFPYSSDDGFSVIDYRTVDPNLGDWDDVTALGEDFDLAFDFVVNHVSQQSAWFQGYLAGEEPYVRYFHEVDPDVDLSAVTRPRSLPLLSEYETSRGPRHVWTTFSADQIDVNFSEPEVLVEMLDILLSYVQHGARIIRLDAIAFLWKRIGTTCLHLDETHEVVKLMRDLLEVAAPGTILLTETNVPHEENISYFGDGDEAQMVYQFPLAPLLLDALLNEDAAPLTDWLAKLDPPPAGATYFNFTASHDGIGVRPAEGLLSPDRVGKLAEAVRARGGRVNMRRNSDGTDSPYELNIAYFDALGDPAGMSVAKHVSRFLASQAVMLSLRGIPGIYFHSLVGTSNDYVGVERTGQNRSINRRKFRRPELQGQLVEKTSAQAQVFAGYRRLLTIRSQQGAFHPDASQEVWQVTTSGVVALMRTSTDGGQRILVLVNLSGSDQTVEDARLGEIPWKRDLLSEKVAVTDNTVIENSITLEPYQVVWLEA